MHIPRTPDGTGVHRPRPGMVYRHLRCVQAALNCPHPPQAVPRPSTTPVTCSSPGQRCSPSPTPSPPHCSVTARPPPRPLTSKAPTASKHALPTWYCSPMPHQVCCLRRNLDTDQHRQRRPPGAPHTPRLEHRGHLSPHRRPPDRAAASSHVQRAHHAHGRHRPPPCQTHALERRGRHGTHT